MDTKDTKTRPFLMPSVADHFTREEAAYYLGVTGETMRVWAARKEGPEYIKLGRLVRYTKAALDEYIESHTVRKTYRKLPDKMLTAEEAAAILGIHVSTLRKWRYRKPAGVTLPCTFLSPKMVRYKLSDVNKLIAKGWRPDGRAHSKKAGIK